MPRRHNRARERSITAGEFTVPKWAQELLRYQRTITKAQWRALRAGQ